MPALSKLTTGERLAGLSSALLFASSFADGWGRVSTRAASLGVVGRLDPARGRYDAWEGLGVSVEIALGIALALALLVAGRRVTRRRARPGIYLLLSLVMSALLGLGLVQGPQLGGLESFDGVDVRPGSLTYASAILAGLAVVGGVLHLGSSRSRRRARG